MINNTEKILSRKLIKTEGILGQFAKDMVTLEDSRALTIDSAEALLGETISKFVQEGLGLTGELLNNISAENITKYCKCGKKMIITKRDAGIKVLS